MHKHFDGFQALNEGDYGCHIKYGRPERTVEVEKVLAEYFGAEDAALVRGGGTGAIRALCFALIRNGSKVLVHDASMYMTTQITLEGLGAELIRADFNDFENICDVKDKTQIFNCGNTNSDKTFVFIDDSLDLYPKDIAYWNLGINPEHIGTIKDSSKFYTYYSENISHGGSADLYNYNIYIIVSNKNEKLIKICNLLK
jgi:hypothetical protein